MCHVTRLSITFGLVLLLISTPGSAIVFDFVEDPRFGEVFPGFDSLTGTPDDIPATSVPGVTGYNPRGSLSGFFIDYPDGDPRVDTFSAFTGQTTSSNPVRSGSSVTFSFENSGSEVWGVGVSGVVDPNVPVATIRTVGTNNTVTVNDDNTVRSVFDIENTSAFGSVTFTGNTFEGWVLRPGEDPTLLPGNGPLFADYFNNVVVPVLPSNWQALTLTIAEPTLFTSGNNMFGDPEAVALFDGAMVSTLAVQVTTDPRINDSVAPIPEPGAAALFGLGILGIARVVRGRSTV